MQSISTVIFVIYQRIHLVSWYQFNLSKVVDMEELKTDTAGKTGMYYIHICRHAGEDAPGLPRSQVNQPCRLVEVRR